MIGSFSVSATGILFALTLLAGWVKGEIVRSVDEISDYNCPTVQSIETYYAGTCKSTCQNRITALKITSFLSWLRMILIIQVLKALVVVYMSTSVQTQMSSTTTLLKITEAVPMNFWTASTAFLVL
jgi:hypothetical protein